MSGTVYETALQLLGNNWLLGSVMLTAALVQLGLQTSSSESDGDRLDRVEPRANKRRPKLLALLNKPRRAVPLELLAAD